MVSGPNVDTSVVLLSKLDSINMILPNMCQYKYIYIYLLDHLDDVSEVSFAAFNWVSPTTGAWPTSELPDSVLIPKT